MTAASTRRQVTQDGSVVDQESYSRAILNILEDSGSEKLRLEDAQKATLNILADFIDEQARLADVQRAILNILDDFDTEKRNVERVNRDLAGEIADRKRAEEALEGANKELEAFSYSVSHDLRAPLRSIDGFSQALLEDYSGTLDEQGKEFLQRVRAATQRMARLIDELLALSRVTRADMHREAVSLSALAESLLRELQRADPDRPVDIAIQPGLQATGDPQLLRIVLANLLSNAWKFTGRQPQPHIEFGAVPSAGDPATFFVRDNGAGFDMAYADKLFGAFQRLHSTQEFPGNGIGLATVQRIVHRHGGRVRAEGVIDGGATFFFTLPLEAHSEIAHG